MTDAPAARTARIDILHTGCLTPGTTSTCTLVRDADGVIVFDPGMVERQADLLEPLAEHGLTPADDPYAPDADALHASRARVLAVADLVVPGHGPAFTPDESTPR